MTTKIRTHNLSSRHTYTGIRPEILIALTFGTVIQQDAEYLDNNPGAVAMINLLGLNTAEQGEINSAMDKLKHSDDINRGIQAAEKYMGNVARFLDPVGRAWGIYLNAALVYVEAKGLTAEQKQTFAQQFSIRGLVDFINAMATTDITVEGQNRKQSVAEYMLANVSQFGSTDNNVLSALLPVAIKTRGQLTQQTYIAVVRGLRLEGANPQQDVPRDVIETAAQHQQDYGSHRTTHNGGAQARS